MSERLDWPLLVCLLAVVFFETCLMIRFRDPFPPLATSLSTQVTDLRDFVGIAGGFRRLSADIAWIQALEYYGTQEEGQSEQDFENGLGRYPLMLSYCERVARIDPYFTYVYYYGGGALGWNLGRWEEAERLLRLGIQNNPKEFRLQQYLAAMAYRKDHDATKLILFLEEFIKDPECPNLLRSILANFYKKQKLYDQALRVWVMVYDSGDLSYRDRANQQIQELLPLSTVGHKAP